jgi:hypothetical protein
MNKMENGFEISQILNIKTFVTFAQGLKLNELNLNGVVGNLTKAHQY